ncbi:MAG: PAS domain-containing protein, partial [Candidatus Eremiobacteraeota bacterium]|nr:PAS domain-containing protein [Candidatus Eremiobacteraeota bacterium]
MWTAATLVAGILAGYGLRVFTQPRLAIPQPEVPRREDETTDERFDRLVRALPLGVLMLDRQSKVLFANRAASAIFGFEIARIMGLHLLEAVPSIELEHRVQDALLGEASMGPLIVTGKTGNRTYVVSAYPLSDEQE